MASVWERAPSEIWPMALEASPDAAATCLALPSKQKMVNSNEARSGHNGSPITVVEQESQKRENTKVTFNHALALLDVER